MILNFLSAGWAAIAPAIANHLWQSTMFLAAAWLLTLVLRKNQARVRYGLWLAASVKFLIPFVLLISLGSHLAKPHGTVSGQSGFYSVAEEVSLPFTQPTVPVISPVTPSTLLPSLVHLLPTFLAAMWLCGFVALLSLWRARWRRISAAMREAVPLAEGREVDALRQLESIAGLQKPIPLLLSRGSLEPGIFGIVQPVLLWPSGISGHLEDTHLNAILAHEVWHVRRRDNLAAAIHMVVEAVFWFHPLVWWLGARLIEERERACDEEVLQSGNPPLIYAEGILKTCEFCVGSPLACVSGVTGSNLKKRIVRIMSERVATKLNFRKKLLLGLAGLVAVTVPIIFGLANAPTFAQAPAVRPEFEVASVKRNLLGSRPWLVPPVGGRFRATNVTLKMLMSVGWPIWPQKVLGAPSWVVTDGYDVSAIAPEPNVSRDEFALMMQNLLKDRFALRVHTETHEGQVYVLLPAKNGLKLPDAKPEPCLYGWKAPDADPQAGCGSMNVTRESIVGEKISMQWFAGVLGVMLGRPVLDRTGFKGSFKVRLEFSPVAPGTNSSKPSIFAALEEQLGLRLESQKGTEEVLVIDHVGRPSPN